MGGASSAGVRRRGPPESTAFGFPSGHAAAVASFAVMVVYFVGRSGSGTARRVTVQVLAGLLMLAVGLARIVLRAHWPADVLGGLALGTTCAAAAAWWDAAQPPIPRRVPADGQSFTVELPGAPQPGAPPN